MWKMFPPAVALVVLTHPDTVKTESEKKSVACVYLKPGLLELVEEMNPSVTPPTERRLVFVPRNKLLFNVSAVDPEFASTPFIRK